MHIHKCPRLTERQIQRKQAEKYLFVKNKVNGDSPIPKLVPLDNFLNSR